MLLPPALVAVIALIASLVTSMITYTVTDGGWEARYERDMRQKEQDWGAAIERARDEVEVLKEQNLEDADRIAKLSRNARVRCYSTSRVPANTVRTDADTARDDRETGEDLTDVLRQCARTFTEVMNELKGPPK